MNVVSDEEVLRGRGRPRDEEARGRILQASLEALEALRPAFKKDGTVTAGNAPGVNDAAAALVVMSAAKAAELGLQFKTEV